MNINGKAKADLVKIQIKSNESNDGKEAFVDLEIGVDRAAGERIFGESFVKLAFGGFVEERDEDETPRTVCLHSKIKPRKKSFVCSMHKIEIGGYSVTAQPELLSVEPIDGSEQVVAVVRITLGVDALAAASKLVQSVGEVVSVSFDPAQQVLPFSAAG